MIAEIKERLWQVLAGKEVSLAMIYDRRGEILWHRGRHVIGKNVSAKGCGFCSTPARQSLQQPEKKRLEKLTATYSQLHGVESARILNVKSLVILPLNEQYFLYLDSGVKEGFSESDTAVFASIGLLLEELIGKLRQGKQTGMQLSGESPKIKEIRDKIFLFAVEEEPILILGETGVGKSRLAEIVHRVSGRPGPLITINTPGIPDGLIESQLFGHRKGAFTGAISDTRGFVAAAEKGTLFMDEISEIEPGLQAKLLRFIDQKKYYRLGDTVELSADVRLITATNSDLHQMIAAKTFREDLFFRLNCLTIEIPPLRDRKDDLEILIAENKELLRGKKLSGEARLILREYDWPGNVRELIQTLKLAGILLPDQEIGPQIKELLNKNRPAGFDKKRLRIEQIWQGLLGGESFWKSVKEPFLQRDLNRGEVKEILDRGLRATGGVYSALLPLFNLEKGEYKNFMRFIYENKLK